MPNSPKKNGNRILNLVEMSLLSFSQLNLKFYFLFFRRWRKMTFNTPPPSIWKLNPTEAFLSVFVPFTLLEMQLYSGNTWCSTDHLHRSVLKDCWDYREKPCCFGAAQVRAFQWRGCVPPQGGRGPRATPPGGERNSLQFSFSELFPQMPGINTFLANEYNPCSDAACIHLDHI